MERRPTRAQPCKVCSHQQLIKFAKYEASHITNVASLVLRVGPVPSESRNRPHIASPSRRMGDFQRTSQSHRFILGRDAGLSTKTEPNHPLRASQPSKPSWLGLEAGSMGHHRLPWAHMYNTSALPARPPHHSLASCRGRRVGPVAPRQSLDDGCTNRMTHTYSLNSSSVCTRGFS